MTVLAATADQFLQLLRARHATILGGRPDRRPGFFKEVRGRMKPLGRPALPKAGSGVVSETGLADFCHVLLTSNEFLYVD
jgi:hypothetical protein